VGRIVTAKKSWLRLSQGGRCSGWWPPDGLLEGFACEGVNGCDGGRCRELKGNRRCGRVQEQLRGSRCIGTGLAMFRGILLAVPMVNARTDVRPEFVTQDELGLVAVPCWHEALRSQQAHREQQPEGHRPTESRR